MAVITSTLNAAGVLRVYINGILHLLIPTDAVVEIQSWKMTTRDPPMFVIERTYREGASQISDYDQEDTWRRVLSEIDSAYGKVHA